MNHSLRRVSIRAATLWLGLSFLLVLQPVVCKPLCSDSTGVFVGLATDEESYTTHQGPVGDDDENSNNNNDPQNWILTAENRHNSNGAGGRGPQNSYDSRFLQVLPDSGRTYPGRGEHLQRANDLDGHSPYISFRLKVTKEGQGIHTLFLRWTGGDTVGGGDSLYVVLYKSQKKNDAKKTLVNGQQTVKPAVVPINAGMSRYAGCCYDPVRACVCLSVCVLVGWLVGWLVGLSRFFGDCNDLWIAKGFGSLTHSLTHVLSLDSGFCFF